MITSVTPIGERNEMGHCIDQDVGQDVYDGPGFVEVNVKGRPRPERDFELAECAKY
jgi:hypothetical protein